VCFFKAWLLRRLCTSRVFSFLVCGDGGGGDAEDLEVPQDGRQTQEQRIWGHVPEESHLLKRLLREQDMSFHYAKPLKHWNLFAKSVCISLTNPV